MLLRSEDVVCWTGKGNGRRDTKNGK